VEEYTAAYCETVRRLARAGLPTLSYSFMPLFDWVRTDLAVPWRDGSLALALSMDRLRMWDLHVLARPGAADCYTAEEVGSA
jgi:mannonate dehydratase